MSEPANEDKKEPLGGEVAEEYSKKKIIAYYGLTVGLVILVVIIALIIAIKFDDPSAEETDSAKSNLFTSTYTTENNKKIKLFDSKLKEFIDSMKIDGEKVETTDEHAFEKNGEHKVEVTLKKELESLENLFKDCKNLTQVNLSEVKMAKVKSMAGMFSGCNFLKSLDLSNLLTSNVETMDGLFKECYSLASINLTNVKTSNVKSMKNMFYECHNLQSLDLSEFETKNVDNMEGMFYDCNALGKLDLSKFDTSNVQTMSKMFEKCVTLSSINMDNFDTSKVEDMSSMFASNSLLTSLDLSKFKTENVKNMNSMFSECLKLTQLDLKSFVTTELVDMGHMFYNDRLSSLNLSTFDTSNVENMEEAFGKCENLKSLDITKFSSKKLKSKNNIFTDLPENGTLVYNSDLFEEECLKGSNVENWDLKKVNEE